MGVQNLSPSKKLEPHYLYEPYSNIVVIQPNARTLENAVSPTPLTEEMVDSVRTRKSLYYLYGEILYEDIWNQPHYTHFCVFLRPDLKGFFHCNTYNDVDTEKQR